MSSWPAAAGHASAQRASGPSLTGRITVVHVITKLELGGAQENTLVTVEQLDRGRFDVALWSGPGGLLDDEAARIPHLDRRVFEDLRREVRPAGDARALVAMVRALREARRAHEDRGGHPRAFILHTHSSKAGILGRLAGRAAGVPIIIHSIHGFGFHDGQDPRTHAVFLNAERAAARATDAFISVSYASLAEGRARGVVLPGQPAVVIRSGFDLVGFRAEAARGLETRRELGLTPEDEVLVAIANLKPQKDPLTLMRALPAVLRARPRAVLLYAGDGELRSEVEAEIARLGIVDHVRLLGWRRDVPAVIGAGDVVVLSSIFEGLPRSAVQAVVARRPFVGTRVDGTSEIIRNGKNGWLVEPRDPEALARAIVRTLETRPLDPDDVARVEAWAAPRMVADQEEFYTRLVGPL